MKDTKSVVFALEEWKQQNQERIVGKTLTELLDLFVMDTNNGLLWQILNRKIAPPEISLTLTMFANNPLLQLADEEIFTKLYAKSASAVRGLYRAGPQIKELAQAGCIDGEKMLSLFDVDTANLNTLFTSDAERKSLLFKKIAEQGWEKFLEKYKEENYRYELLGAMSVVGYTDQDFEALLNQI